MGVGGAEADFAQSSHEMSCPSQLGGLKSHLAASTGEMFSFKLKPKGN